MDFVVDPEVSGALAPAVDAPAPFALDSSLESTPQPPIPLPVSAPLDALALASDETPTATDPSLAGPAPALALGPVAAAAPAPAALPLPPARSSRPPQLPPALPQPNAPVAPAPEPRLTRAKANPASAQARRSFKEGTSSDEEGDDGDEDDPDASGEEDDEHHSHGQNGKPAWAKATKTRWTPTEDAELVRLVRIKPALTWTEIGEQMPGRKASGCMMRWYNFIREEGRTDPDRRPDAPADDDPDGNGEGTSGTPATKEREKKARGGATGAGESKVRRVSQGGDGSAYPSVLSANGEPKPAWLEDGSLPVAGPATGSVVRGRRTYSPGQLEGQLKTPSGKAMKVHACPAENCAAAFKRSEHLKRHYRSVHLGAKPFDCEDPKCGKSFSRKDNLRQHMKMVHAVDSPPSPRYVPPGQGGQNNPNNPNNPNNNGNNGNNGSSSSTSNSLPVSDAQAAMGTAQADAIVKSILDAAAHSGPSNSSNNHPHPQQHSQQQQHNPHPLQHSHSLSHQQSQNPQLDPALMEHTDLIASLSNHLQNAEHHHQQQQQQQQQKRGRSDEDGEEHDENGNNGEKRRRSEEEYGGGGGEQGDLIVPQGPMPSMGLGNGMEDDDEIGVIGLEQIGGGLLVGEL
ncbi:hypothetical protein RQP46_010954 [Phenoliferia psychrophenolica]